MLRTACLQHLAHSHVLEARQAVQETCMQGLVAHDGPQRTLQPCPGRTALAGIDEGLHGRRSLIPGPAETTKIVKKAARAPGSAGPPSRGPDEERRTRAQAPAASSQRTSCGAPT